MRRRLIAAVALVVLAGCSTVGAPGATPSAQPVAITSQVLAMLLEEHFGTAAAVTGGSGSVTAVRPTEWVDGITATAYYRATPGHAARTLTVGYSPAPYDGSFGCSAGRCEQRDGVWLRGKPVDLVAARDEGFVQVSARDGSIPDELMDAAISLARDTRIAPTVDAGLAASAAANPRWRVDDLGCGDATVSGPIALPAADSGSESPTPQALAAVVASRVAASCAGDESTGSAVRGTVYLGADTERVSLALADDARTCANLDRCGHQGAVTIGWQLDVPSGYPRRVILSRPAADGRHWIEVEAASMTSTPGTAGSVIPLKTLIALVTDPRVGPTIDPALNRAGDALPLRWRFTPRTAE